MILVVDPVPLPLGSANVFNPICGKDQTTIKRIPIGKMRS